VARSRVWPGVGCVLWPGVKGVCCGQELGGCCGQEKGIGQVFKEMVKDMMMIKMAMVTIDMPSYIGGASSSS